MGEVLYEVHYQFEFALFIPLIMLFVIPFFPKMEEQRTGREMSVVAKIFLVAAWCLVLAAVVLVGKFQLDMYNTVVGAYKSGEYQIVEGYVENFEYAPPDKHKSESFDINGVHFSYSDATVMTGYHKEKSSGGVITGNGQFLKIGYVYYDDLRENVIVYIEALPASS